MRRHPKPSLLALGLACLFLLPGGALAEGFGTPTLDGLLTGDEAIYNLVEAADSCGDAPQGNTNMDLCNLYVANDTNFWYFLFTINTDIGATNWGKYMLFVDVTNDSTGAPDDSSSTWGRDIAFAAPHQPEYSLRSWVDAGTYGPEDTQWHAWNGTSWVDTLLPADGAALTAAATSGIEWKVAKSKMGSPSMIWCEVISTGANTGDPAQDTANDPPEDWNAVNWTDTATISVSTLVNEQTGADTTPPTLSDGCVTFILGSPGVTNLVDLTFNEPMNPATLANPANYTASNNTVSSVAVTGLTTVRLTLGSNYGFGACQQISVTGVQDQAGNTIVANGTTNVSNFYIYQIHMRGRMAFHMAADPDTGNGHSFGWEGDTAPLTWDPLCDLPLNDPDMDSTWTETLNFCLPCSTGTGGAEVTQMQYKFTHGISGTCEHYESMGGNHFYTFDVALQPDGVDTLDIWWDDQAPSNFTAVDIDVVFRVQNLTTRPPFAVGDSLAVAGSEAPLTWAAAPPVNMMFDDGVAPDDSAGDGIYSTRMTFPAGSLENVQFKYLLNAMADTSGFVFECSAGDTTLPSSANRNVFLNDSLFSTTTPIVMDVAYLDDCSFATGVEEVLEAVLEGRLLEQSSPNPLRSSTLISYSLPESGPVRIDVYDVRGRHVRTLVDEVRAAGRHHVVWAGRRESGAALPNGVYFYRLRTADRIESRKLVLIR